MFVLLRAKNGGGRRLNPLRDLKIPRRLAIPVDLRTNGEHLRRSIEARILHSTQILSWSAFWVSSRSNIVLGRRQEDMNTKRRINLTQEMTLRIPLLGQRRIPTIGGMVSPRVQGTGGNFGAIHGEGLVGGQTGTLGPTQDGNHLIEKGLQRIIRITILVRWLTD